MNTSNNYPPQMAPTPKGTTALGELDMQMKEQQDRLERIFHRLSQLAEKLESSDLLSGSPEPTPEKRNGLMYSLYANVERYKMIISSIDSVTEKLEKLI